MALPFAAIAKPFAVKASGLAHAEYAKVRAMQAREQIEKDKKEVKDKAKAAGGAWTVSPEEAAFYEQCARVAFSAYQSEQDLKCRSRSINVSEGGLPWLQVEAPPVVIVSCAIQLVLWKLHDTRGHFHAVGIRGTDISEPLNILTNLDYTLIPLKQIFDHDNTIRPMVHSGFATTFLQIRSDFRKMLTQYATDVRRVVVTGHSLGGALAVLAGLDLAIDQKWAQGGTSSEAPSVSVVTFGKPHVGDQQFCNFFANRYLSNDKNTHIDFFSSADPVPRLCPVVNAAYMHEGQRCQLDCSMDQWLHNLQALEKFDVQTHSKSRLDEVCRCAATVVQYHSCKYYWSLIQGLDIPDRRSVQRATKLLQVGVKTCIEMIRRNSYNQHNPAGLVQKIMVRAPQLRGAVTAVGGTGMLSVAAGVVAVTLCVGVAKGVADVNKIRKDVEKLQHQLHTTTQMVANVSAEIKDLQKDFKDAQDRLESMILDLPNEIRKELQEHTKTTCADNIETTCDHVLELLSDGVNTDNEMQTMRLEERKLRNHLEKSWPQERCGVNADRIRRIQRMCELCVYSLRVRAACLANGAEKNRSSLQPVIDKALKEFAPTLGKMVLLCLGTEAGALQHVTDSFRSFCCFGLEGSLEAIDILMLAKIRDYPNIENFPTEWQLEDKDWFILLALDCTNYEARAALAKSLFLGQLVQAESVKQLARDNVAFIIKCAWDGESEKEPKSRIAVLDGLLGLCRDESKLEQCLSSASASVKLCDPQELLDALLAVSDMARDIDRLSDVLTAASCVQHTIRRSSETPVMSSDPAKWKGISDNILRFWLDDGIVVKSHQLLKDLFPALFYGGEIRVLTPPPQLAGSVWQAIAESMIDIANEARDVVTDQRCLDAIMALANQPHEVRTVQESFCYRMTYDENSQQVLLAFAGLWTRTMRVQSRRQQQLHEMRKFFEGTVDAAEIGENNNRRVNSYMLSLARAAKTQLVQELSEKCKEHNAKGFVFTGHAVAGALAIAMRAVMLISQESESVLQGLEGRVVTFGAPLVLAGQWQNFPELQKGCRCYVNDQDFFPRLCLDKGEYHKAWKTSWEYGKQTLNRAIQSQKRLSEQAKSARSTGRLAKIAAKALTAAAAAAGGAAATLATGGVASGVFLVLGAAAAGATAGGSERQSEADDLARQAANLEQNLEAAETVLLVADLMLDSLDSMGKSAQNGFLPVGQYRVIGGNSICEPLEGLNVYFRLSQPPSWASDKTASEDLCFNVIHAVALCVCEHEIKQYVDKLNKLVPSQSQTMAGLAAGILQAKIARINKHVTASMADVGLSEGSATAHAVKLCSNIINAQDSDDVSTYFLSTQLQNAPDVLVKCFVGEGAFDNNSKRFDGNPKWCAVSANLEELLSQSRKARTDSVDLCWLPEELELNTEDHVAGKSNDESEKGNEDEPACLENQQQAAAGSIEADEPKQAECASTEEDPESGELQRRVDDTAATGEVKSEANADNALREVSGPPPLELSMAQPTDVLPYAGERRALQGEPDRCSCAVS